MDLLSFVVGMLTVTVGIVGLASETYRWMRGSGRAWKRIPNGLWSSASLTGGLYLILGSTVMLAAFVLLVVAGGAHQAHVRRERNRQGLEA